MTRDSYEPHPAISRAYDHEKDGEHYIPRYGEKPEKIISQPNDTVTHSRGFGDSGKRVQVVSHDCPECGFDRMVRKVRVTPVERDSVQYWCLNPNCVHFVRDHLSYACHGNYPQRDTDSPAELGDADA